MAPYAAKYGGRKSTSLDSNNQSGNQEYILGRLPAAVVAAVISW